MSDASVGSPCPYQAIAALLDAHRNTHLAVLNLIAQATDCPSVMVALTDTEMLRPTLHAGTPITMAPQSLAALHLYMTRILTGYVTYSADDACFAHTAWGQSGQKFFAAAPLLLGDGMVGSVCALSQRSPRDAAHVQNMLLQGAQAIVGHLRLAQAHHSQQTIDAEQSATAPTPPSQSQTHGALSASLLDHLPVMICLKDAATERFVEVNRTVEDISGIPRAEMIGKTLPELFPHAVPHATVRHNRDVVASGLPVGVSEDVIPSRHRGNRILRTKRVPICNPDGSVKYVLGVSEDITDMRQAEFDLDRFFRMSLDMLVMTRANGTFMRINPAVQTILGFTPEEACNMPYTSMIHPDDIASTAAAVQSALDGEVLLAFENRYRCKDGSYKWISWKSVAMGDILYATGRDVTREHNERTAREELNRQLEARVLERTHELAKTAERYQRIVSSNMIGICFVGKDRVVVEANDSFLGMIGYTRDELATSQVDLPRLATPESVDLRAAAAAQVMSSGVCQPYETELFRKDGSRVPVLVGAAMLPGAEDHAVCFVIDQTASKRTEAEQNASHLREQTAIEASKLKSAFLANMSHEIRTPINGVVGMLGLLQNTALQPEQREYVEAANASASSLLIVINDILDFSKVEAGKLTIDNVAFDTTQLLAEIEKSFWYQARAKGLRLTFTIDPKLPQFLNGDPGRIQQILNNLLSNAFKFTAAGFIDVVASCDSLEGNKVRLRVNVFDTGIGISAAAQGAIFEPFSQADASTTRRFGGTGLGLSICRYLVEQMHGQIGVDSVEHKGANFWFVVTLHQVDAVTPQAAEPTCTFDPGWSRSKRILIAEDNLVNQKIALKYLENMNLQADAVASGMAVIAALQARTYDLILMDCQMPEMDGYDTTRMIRAGESAAPADLPIVAMTAGAMAGERERCLTAGMDDYISKPAKPRDLFAVLQTWLKV